MEIVKFMQFSKKSEGNIKVEANINVQETLNSSILDLHV